MPCYQSTGLPSGVIAAGRTSYKTEAECMNACKEGACCEGTTCTVKPQCQCQGTGKTFKGVGTTCSPNPCVCYCSDGETLQPTTLTVVWGDGPPSSNQVADAFRGTYTLSRTSCGEWKAVFPTPSIIMGISNNLESTSTLRFTCIPDNVLGNIRLFTLTLNVGRNTWGDAFFVFAPVQWDQQNPCDVLCNGGSLRSVSVAGSNPYLLVTGNPLP